MASQEVIAYSQLPLTDNSCLQTANYSMSNFIYIFNTHSWTLHGHGHPFHTHNSQNNGHIS